MRKNKNKKNAIDSEEARSDERTSLRTAERPAAYDAAATIVQGQILALFCRRRNGT